MVWVVGLELPAGSTILSGLRTSFVVFERLLDDLRSQRVTGYLLVRFDESSYVVLLYQGFPAVTIHETPSTTGVTSGVSGELFKDVGSKVATIEARGVPEGEMVGVFLGCLERVKPVLWLRRSNLDLVKAVADLEEQGFNGWVRVEGDGRIGVFVFSDGKRVLELFLDGEKRLVGEEARNSFFGVGPSVRVEFCPLGVAPAAVEPVAERVEKPSIVEEVAEPVEEERVEPVEEVEKEEIVSLVPDKPVSELTEEEKKYRYLESLGADKIRELARVFDIRSDAAPRLVDKVRQLADMLLLSDCDKLYRLNKVGKLDRKAIEAFHEFVLARLYSGR